MPATVRRRLLVFVGINPDASRWGTIPYEIQLMILKAAGPLTLFVNDLLGDKSILDDATIEALWTDVIAQDWQGDLDLLPDVRFNIGEVDRDERRPSVDTLSLPVTRPMYGRLRICFPGQARAEFVDDEAFDDDFDDDQPGDEFYDDDDDDKEEPDAPLLRHIPMRNCWFDLVDFRYPLTLGWWSIKFGHVGLLKYLADHHGVNPKKYKKFEGHWAIDMAAAYGHVGIVQWLHTNGARGCTTNAMDSAAFAGFLDVVKWLHANQTEGCTMNAMNGAVMNGHLDVVQWLHANRTEGCSHWAMDSAALNSRLEVVRFLVDCGHLFTIDALCGAATATILGVLVDSMSLARAKEMLQIARCTAGLTNLVARLERAVAEQQAEADA